MLTISREKVCFVVVKARELNVKVEPEELYDDADDVERILEDYADDSTYQEIREFLEALNDDELGELLALTWVGRGDYPANEWQTAVNAVRDTREKHIVGYLLGTPLLADYLEEGLSQFGQSCEEFEIGRM